MVISTGDKDFAQLVSPGITLVNTMTNTTTDVDGVIARYGVPPERIVDFLALTGDTVDNVPGVDKVRTEDRGQVAVEHGSLDGVIAAAADVGGKIGENLRAALPHLPLSRELVTIKTDVDLDVGPTDLGLRAPQADTLRELYRRYEFNAALKELDRAPPADADESSTPAPSAPATGDATTAPATAIAGEYECIRDEARLAAWIERLRSAALVSIDTEPTSQPDARRDRRHLVAVGPARPPTCRSATTTRGHRHSSTVRRCLPR